MIFQSNGVEYVCDVLCEEPSTEGSRSEAAGLVAQITAPWTEGSGYVLQSINQNAHRLIQSIASKFLMQKVSYFRHVINYSLKIQQ